MDSNANPRSILDVIPIQIVPVWENIFSYLPAQDLVSCSATAQAWRDALELERTAFFNMAEVFPILLGSGYIQRREIHDILNNSRLVCRFWKIIIDRFLQNHPEYFRKLRVDIRGTMPSFLKKLLASDNFPSLSRSISYIENERAHWNDPWAATNTCVSRLRSDFTRLLERVGSQILHCNMVFLLQTMGAIRIGGHERCPVGEDACKTDPETLYKLARSFLLLMPNLRTLSLTGGYIYGYDQDQHLMTPSMMQLMVEQPLPPLNDLVTMKLNNVPNPLETGTLQTYNHIRELSITCYGIGLHDDPVIPDSLENIAMPNLDVLEVNLHSPQDFYKLPTLSTNPPWRLTSLNINFGIEELVTIFRTASHFGNTLRHLIIGTWIGVTNSYVQEALLMARLELPQLETCRIHCDPIYIYSIDFLLPCTKLRRLRVASEIAARDERPVDLQTIIQFQGHFDSMYESNIWTLLPKLDVFELTMKPHFHEDPNLYYSHAYGETIHTYTRSEYLVN